MKSLVKVGIFASICLVVLAVLIWKVEDLNPFGVKGQRLNAVFNSIAGLDDKASVRIAGVRVGQVDGVGLQGTKARVGLSLDKPIPLTVGTTARIASLGLLGEKYVEIIPGPPGAYTTPDRAIASRPFSRMLFVKYFAMCVANPVVGSSRYTHVGTPMLSPPAAHRLPTSSARSIYRSRSAE